MRDMKAFRKSQNWDYMISPTQVLKFLPKDVIDNMTLIYMTLQINVL